jgi:hypothetical protein
MALVPRNFAWIFRMAFFKNFARAKKGTRHSKVVCPTGYFIVKVLASWREFQNFSRQLGYFDRREVLCIYLRYGSRETLHMDQD